MTRSPSFSNQQINSVVVDESRSDPAFVFHSLRLLRDQLRSRAGGSATPILNKSAFCNVALLLPPVDVQRVAGRILSAYDDLIENCERRIRVLDEMARALYREWFVNFRYPGHERVPLVDSPLGRIPKGWRVLAVEEILSRRVGGTVWREGDAKREGRVPIIDQSTDEVLGFHDDATDHVATLEKPIAIFGDHTCKMQLLVEPFSIGPNVVPFCADQDYPLHYVFQLVRSLVTTQEYKRHWTVLVSNTVVVAERAIAERFSELTRPMQHVAEALRKTKHNVRKTRDLLLPRLLSGQLSVEDAAA